MHYYRKKNFTYRRVCEVQVKVYEYQFDNGIAYFFLDIMGLNIIIDVRGALFTEILVPGCFSRVSTLFFTQYFTKFLIRFEG